MNTQKKVFRLILVLFGLATFSIISLLKIETITPSSGDEFSVQYVSDGYLTVETDKGVVNVSEDDMALKIIAHESSEYIQLLRLFNDNYFVITVALHNRH